MFHETQHSHVICFWASQHGRRTNTFPVCFNKDFHSLDICALCRLINNIPGNNTTQNSRLCHLNVSVQTEKWRPLPTTSSVPDMERSSSLTSSPKGDVTACPGSSTSGAVGLTSCRTSSWVSAEGGKHTMLLTRNPTCKHCDKESSVCSCHAPQNASKVNEELLGCSSILSNKWYSGE